MPVSAVGHCTQPMSTIIGDIGYEDSRCCRMHRQQRLFQGRPTNLTLMAGILLCWHACFCCLLCMHTAESFGLICCISCARDCRRHKARFNVPMLYVKSKAHVPEGYIYTPCRSKRPCRAACIAWRVICRLQECGCKPPPLPPFPSPPF